MKGKTNSSIVGQIGERIRLKGRGWCFTPSAFEDLGDPAALRVTLFRMVRAGEIRRLARGIYDFPRFGGDGAWAKADPLMLATLSARRVRRQVWTHDPLVVWAREGTDEYGGSPPLRGIETKSRIVILAGPNGAGKTTFAREYLPREGNCPIFVNVDLIAAGLSPFSPDRAALQAGKIMLQRVAWHVRRRESFAFETTLSGLGYARMIPQWRRSGFHVHVTFLALPSAEMAVSRVALRVLQGGHSIPENVIRRRYEAGWRNFQTIYRILPDSWQVFDNSGPTPVMIDKGENGG